MRLCGLPPFVRVGLLSGASGAGSGVNTPARPVMAASVELRSIFFQNILGLATIDAVITRRQEGSRPVNVLERL